MMLSRFAAIGGVVFSLLSALYFAESPIAMRDRWSCCAKHSLNLEKMDAFSSTSILSSMRSKALPDDPLGHLGERLNSNVLDGVWWMDGNAGPEELVTFADAHFSTVEFQQYLILPTLDVEGGTWAYPDTILGRGNFVQQCVVDVRPKFVLDDTRTRLDKFLTHIAFSL